MSSRAARLRRRVNNQRIGRRRIRRLPQGPDMTEPIDLENVQLPTTPTCIDLTEEVDQPFVDLTDVTNTPIVIGSSQSGTPPLRRRLRMAAQNYDRSENDNSDGDDVISLPDLDPNLDFSTPVSSQTDEAQTVTAGAAEDGAGSGRSISSPAGAGMTSPPNTSISCPVCMDSIRQIHRNGRKLLSTTCGHLFCNECIRGAINAQHRCPTCRKRLTMRQTHPIFL